MSDAHSASFRRYLDLVIELHQLIRGNADGSPRAHAIRDEMESLEPALSEQQLMHAERLSAELHSLRSREAYGPSGSNNLRDCEELQAAVHAQDYLAVLNILRRGTIFIDAAHKSYFRGRAYDWMGMTRPALEFMDHASSLQPTNPTFKALALEIMAAGGLYADAHARACKHLHDASPAPRLVIVATGVLLRSWFRLPSLEQPDLQTLTDRLTKALQAEEGRKDRLPAVLSGGYSILSLLYELLGRSQDAIHAMATAISFGSDRPNLILRSYLEHLQQRPVSNRTAGRPPYSDRDSRSVLQVLESFRPSDSLHEPLLPAA
jgi:hypothetical protein